MGFLVSNMVESMENISLKVTDSMNPQIVMGSINFSLEKLQQEIESTNKVKQKKLVQIMTEVIGNTTADIKDWIKTNVEVSSYHLVIQRRHSGLQ